MAKTTREIMLPSYHQLCRC